MGFLNLPTLAEMRAQPKAVPKGKPRVDVKAAVDKLDARLLDIWRNKVFRRDKHRCRCCGRKVIRTLNLVPNRAEAHHLEGRAMLALRHDRRNGLTLCLSPCHRRVTGNVNDKLIVVGSKFFKIDGVRYIDGDRPVTFKEAK